MLRYVALVWNDADASKAEFAQLSTERLHSSRTKWNLAIEERGLRVFYTGATEQWAGVHRLAEGHGVVLGTIFRLRGEWPRPVTLDDPLDASETNQILISRGRALVDTYWGNYVALLHEPASRTTSVLRGPMSLLPCLRTQCCGIEVFCSYLEDWACLGLQRFSINWTYAARYLMGPVLTEQTGLNEVSEVRAGNCARVEPTGTRIVPYWHPMRPGDAVQTVSDAVQQIHDTIRRCVHAWSSGYDSIIHHLSGGLDSSVVLACLADAPSKPRVTCVTEHSPGADSDERLFARLAAQRAGCPLIERRRDPTFRIERLLDIPRLESPTGAFRQLETAPADRTLAAETGATAVFSGSGGDELFCRHHTHYYVVDFVRDHGIRPAQLRSLLGLALDSAVTEGCTIWLILRRAVCEGLFQRESNMLEEMVLRDFDERLLLRKDVALDLSRNGTCGFLADDWARRCSPGRLWQLYLVTSRREYYNPFAQPGDPEYISPLLSQPIVELCLRIPTYLQRYGRWDRSIVRRAFAPQLPAEVAWRRSKGGMEEHASEILTRNLPFIRDILLDGALSARGFVDRQKLVNALDSGPAAVASGVSQILKLLSVEVWTRTWAD
ncbi:MAG TPA: asparagine synthase C-terminal domain-containing protein [Steroidobacter sp.]